MSFCEATIVITTRNRRDDLRGAVRSALEQAGAVEVLVIDDGSTDGTAEMIRREFPRARLEVSAESRGYIVQRNRGAELALGPIVFSIDDDAVFSTPQIVRQTLEEFSHPRVGAVAIPFVDVRKDPAVRQRAPGEEGLFVADRFIGTAHALRRDLFLALGGYREGLVHQGEEGDFCLRLLAAGRVTRLGRADPIHHLESPRRNVARMTYFGRRNDILFHWCNTPLPHLPLRLLGAGVKGLAHAVGLGETAAALRGLAAGLAACGRQWGERRPVPRRAYALHRRLRRGPLPLEAIEAELPPLRPVP